MSFLISHYALHSTQSGFRPNHSCETALLQTINKFHEAINNGQIIGMVMVDFRKAFDLVDHTLLLKKLRHYKISDETLLWFSSYLLNRKQKVVINYIESTTDDDDEFRFNDASTHEGHLRQNGELTWFCNETIIMISHKCIKCKTRTNFKTKAVILC